MVKLTVIFALIASLFGGSTAKKPQVSDGPGMMYKDSDYRTVYANLLDFDSYDGRPYFAVAFLGYGDTLGGKSEYVRELFSDIRDFDAKKIECMEFDGDEWYLVVPRYRDNVDIKDLENNKTYMICCGEPFIVRCNMNIEISIDGGAHLFSPQIDEAAKLVTNNEIHDITNYENAKEE